MQEEFRDSLAKTLKNIEGHSDRKEFLDQVKDTKAYKESREQRLSERELTSGDVEEIASSMPEGKEELTGKEITDLLEDLASDNRWYDYAVLVTNLKIAGLQLPPGDYRENLSKGLAERDEGKRSTAEYAVLTVNMQRAGFEIPTKVDKNAAQRIVPDRVKSLMDGGRFQDALYLISNTKFLDIEFNYDEEKLRNEIIKEINKCLEKDQVALFLHLCANLKNAGIDYSIVPQEKPALKEKLSNYLKELLRLNQIDLYVKVMADIKTCDISL